ncbi:hypothetical protein JW978_04050 [Candidatus Dojkabacteria bacterium]|nr:hypothetical protein [Candidatus Dojkabacteria bacterium]
MLDFSDSFIRKYINFLSLYIFLAGNIILILLLLPGDIDITKVEISKLGVSEKYGTIFNMLFMFCGLLEVGFAYLIIKRFKFNFYESLFFLTPWVLTFGIGFFNLDSNETLHKFSAYSFAITWIFMQLVMIIKFYSKRFKNITLATIFFQLLTGVVFLLYYGKINGVFEMTYMTFVYFWAFYMLMTLKRKLSNKA